MSNSKTFLKQCAQELGQRAQELTRDYGPASDNPETPEPDEALMTPEEFAKEETREQAWLVTKGLNDLNEELAGGQGWCLSDRALVAIHYVAMVDLLQQDED